LSVKSLVSQRSQNTTSCRERYSSIADIRTHCSTQTHRCVCVMQRLHTESHRRTM